MDGHNKSRNQNDTLEPTSSERNQNNIHENNEVQEGNNPSREAVASPIMRNKRHFSFRRLNTMSTFNDVDIDNHLDSIREILPKINHSIDQRMFADLILSILDKILELNNVKNTFNRIIFNYIIEFGNFKKDSTILLLDFFRAFFTIYENMKINRGELYVGNDTINKKLPSLRTKLVRLMQIEKSTGEGATSESVCEVKVIRVDKHGENKVNIIVEIIDEEPKSGTEKIEIDLENVENLNKVFSLKLTKSKLKIKVSYKLEINPDHSDFDINSDKNLLRPVLLEEIDNQDLIENAIVNTYKVREEAEFDLYLISKMSMLDHTNLKIASLEAKLSDNKNNIRFLESAIRYFEEAMDYKYNEQTQSNLLKSELEVSENIEYYILKALGKNLIIWEQILFWMNKIVFMLTFLVLLDRPDFLSQACFVGVFLFEKEIIAKIHLQKIFNMLVCLVILDILWFAYCYVIYTNSKVIEIGKLALNLSVSICKLTMMFSLWRMSVAYRMSSFNDQVAKIKFRKGKIDATPSANQHLSQTFNARNHLKSIGDLSLKQ